MADDQKDYKQAQDAPALNGQDKLSAADTIRREALRWKGLMAVADHLTATGSLEAAATAAEMRRSLATDQHGELQGRIAQAMETLALKTKAADDVVAEARDQADAIGKEAAKVIDAAMSRANQLEEEAKDQAVRIVNSGKAEAEAYVEKIKMDNAQATADFDAKAAQLKNMDSEIAKRQKVLDGINAQLASIAGGLNNAASNTSPSSA